MYVSIYIGIPTARKIGDMSWTDLCIDSSLSLYGYAYYFRRSTTPVYIHPSLPPCCPRQYTLIFIQRYTGVHACVYLSRQTYLCIYLSVFIYLFIYMYEGRTALRTFSVCTSPGGQNSPKESLQKRETKVTGAKRKQSKKNLLLHHQVVLGVGLEEKEMKISGE